MLLNNDLADDLKTDRSCGRRATFFVGRSPTCLGAPDSGPSSAGLGDRVPASRARCLSYGLLSCGADLLVHAGARPFVRT